MSETQAAISFKLAATLRQQIGAVIEKHDLTLTGLVLDYFRRRVQAEQELDRREHTPGEKLTEVTLLLPDGVHAALSREAARLRISVGEYVYRLCLAAAQGEPGPPSQVFRPQDYPDFSKLTECVRTAYLEDRSPIDALIRLYPNLTPAPIPMAALFNAAIAAVPVEQILSERVELGLRLWREQKRGGTG